MVFEIIKKHWKIASIVLFLFLVIFTLSISIIVRKNYYSKKIDGSRNVISSLELQLKSCKSSSAVAVGSSSSQIDYWEYEPPLYPGYTLDWKLYINEINNLLFLYPKEFTVVKPGTNLYDEIELSRSSGEKIYVQRLKSADSTDRAESRVFSIYIDDLYNGKVLQSDDGFEVTKNSDFISNNYALYVKETRNNSNLIYNSVIIPHYAYSSYTRIRTLDITHDDLVAIYDSFKYLRN